MSVQRLLRGGLLWARVQGRPDSETGTRDTLCLGCLYGPCNAEVGDHGVTCRQQDVPRLDVPVDHALPVSVVESVGDLDGDPD